MDRPTDIPEEPALQRPWIAEYEIDSALAGDLIEAQFPELAPVSAELLGTGWDNTVFRVNRTWTFRFPRRALAVELIRTEAAVLPWLAPQLPLPIPAPGFLGAPTDPFPYPFTGCAFLPGVSASDVGLDDSQRVALAAPLAAFLRALHAVPVQAAERSGAPVDQLGRLEINKRTRQIEERLSHCLDAGLIASKHALLRVAHDVPADWSSGPTHLVHGDLYARHVLIDPSGQASGVIDWGDVHRGHPAVDLALAAGFLPPSAQAAFAAAYGPIDADTWRMARFRALLSACAILTYGADINDAPLVLEGQRSMRYLAESRS